MHNTYPNVSGVLTTGGGLVFSGYEDATFIAHDDSTLDELWRINLGSDFCEDGDAEKIYLEERRATRTQ